MRGQLKNPLKARRIQRVSLNKLLGQAVLQGQLESEPQEPRDLLVLQAHREGRQGRLGLRARELLELQDYLVLTELQGLLDCAGLREAQG